VSAPARANNIHAAGPVAAPTADRPLWQRIAHSIAGHLGLFG
jgi:hypothetical protein